MSRSELEVGDQAIGGIGVADPAHGQGDGPAGRQVLVAQGAEQRGVNYPGIAGLAVAGPGPRPPAGACAGGPS